MKVKDMMEPINDYLAPDTPLQEAVTRMREAKRQHGLSVKGMIVLDEDKQLVGMLSIKDIMRAAIPSYLTPDLSVFSWDNMLEEMSKRIRKKVVADVMTKEVITIHHDHSLMACADIMIKKGLQRLPVVDEENNILGMVFIRDVFDLIANNILAGEENNAPC